MSYDAEFAKLKVCKPLFSPTISMLLVSPPLEAFLDQGLIRAPLGHAAFKRTCVQANYTVRQQALHALGVLSAVITISCLDLLPALDELVHTISLVLLLPLSF